MTDTTQPTYRWQVADLLKGLGSTSDEVAASLLAAGHHGRRYSNCRCPLAAHLKAHGVLGPVVCPSYVDFDGPDGPDCVFLPPGAFLFREGFDAGRYPALVSP